MARRRAVVARRSERNLVSQAPTGQSASDRARRQTAGPVRRAERPIAPHCLPLGEPFRYAEAGRLAQIGKRSAVVDFGWIALPGAPAW
jgi:NADH dehydrogenase FAD-containing subunit